MRSREWTMATRRRVAAPPRFPSPASAFPARESAPPSSGFATVPFGPRRHAEDASTSGSGSLRTAAAWVHPAHRPKDGRRRSVPRNGGHGGGRTSLQIARKKQSCSLMNPSKPTTTSAIGSGKPLRSASAIVAGTESGQHLLKITGYSRITKDVPTGSDIKSRSFRVGGHGWYIRYYPNGTNSDWSDYISIFLRLDHDVPKGVSAQFRFDLLDNGGKPVPQYTMSTEYIFRDGGFGTSAFINRDVLEKSEHLRDDCFTIRCELTVMKEIQTKDIDVDGATSQPSPAVVPPPDLHDHLEGLLATREGADVKFEVDGKAFLAHSCVLSARSTVFRGELSSLQAKESTATGGGRAAATVIQIEDMEAQDFEAFLHYVYTDRLPEMKEGDAVAMLPDLVAAANRYKMKRLRLVCEGKLCEFVNVRTVASMLTFAGEHQCHELKDVCLRFLEDPGNLREVVKLNGFKHLSPSVLQDLIANLVAGLQLSNA